MSKKKLPNKILPIKCADKSFQEKWYEGRDYLDFPWSMAWCLCSPPSGGKSTIIKNHIIRANPPYEQVLVCHYDADGTHEYDDCGNVEYTARPQENQPSKSQDSTHYRRPQPIHHFQRRTLQTRQTRKILTKPPRSQFGINLSKCVRLPSVVQANV